MQVKEVFADGEVINLEEYLIKCGVENVDEYMNPDESMIEDFQHYITVGNQNLKNIFMREIQ